MREYTKQPTHRHDDFIKSLARRITPKQDQFHGTTTKNTQFTTLGSRFRIIGLGRSIQTSAL